MKEEKKEIRYFRILEGNEIELFRSMMHLLKKKEMHSLDWISNNG